MNRIDAPGLKFHEEALGRFYIACTICGVDRMNGLLFRSMISNQRF